MTTRSVKSPHFQKESPTEPAKNSNLDDLYLQLKRELEQSK